MTRLTTALLFSAVALSACNNESKPEHHRQKISELAPAPTGIEIDSAKLAMFGALPPSFEAKTNPATDDKVTLGRLLFHDKRLSKANDVSCNSCHDLAKFGTDGQAISTGSGGKKGDRNTPTVLNAAGAFVEFWDGRAETVEAVVKDHLASATEMGGIDDKHLVAALKDASYVDAFKKAFPDDADPVTPDNVSKAIGAFLRKLVTPSKWDAYSKDDKTALTEDAKKGFLKFVEVGCPTCHVGPLVGGTMYQKLGKEKPWPNDKDKGRSRVTKLPSDDMMFKVPQLRNIENTSPYFHDASAKTLDEAVKTMASHQLNKDLSDEDVKSIVTWLKALTGTLDPELSHVPELPEGAPKKGAPAKTK